MKNLLTIDSSVFMAAFRPAEQFHSACRSLMDQVTEGKYFVLTPLSVLVEVVAAISRRTGSRVLAKAVQTKLAQIHSIHFIELVPSRALHACELAIALGLRGMDALVLQMAQEMETTLVTLDEELVKRGREVVNIKLVGTLVESS